MCQLKKTTKNCHCTYCGKYIRPESPQRRAYAGYEDQLLCSNCDEEYYWYLKSYKE